MNLVLIKPLSRGYRLMACAAGQKITWQRTSPQVYMQIEILEGIKSPGQVPASIKRIREHMQTSHADLCMLKLTTDIERNG